MKVMSDMKEELDETRAAVTKLKYEVCSICCFIPAICCFIPVERFSMILFNFFWFTWWQHLLGRQGK